MTTVKLLRNHLLFFFFKDKYELYLILLITNKYLPSYFYYDAFRVQNTTTCAINNRFGDVYFKLEYLIFRIAIPFRIMIISSIIITWRVLKIKSRTSNNSNRNSLEINLLIVLHLMP